ncbi:TetR/AcrR family transcriptional regulator [Conexibacter woesei]|uniref:TetR/AcrR family transcriptional regulator n=1 Tax=Conexibacter woesei TaxID=191495 RepID=UPI000412D61A|nr:TetR/AcrR family transcriptional regulator [Conexibacter woesei]
MTASATLPTPRRLPRAERGRQLLDVAEELFIAKGYDRTSIEDIAKAAGVSRPIVYEHHGSKEGVYLACVKRARDALAVEYDAATAGVTDPREQLRLSADVFFATLERDPQRWIVLFGGAAVPVIGELGEQLSELRHQTVTRIMDNLRAHAVAGLDSERVEMAAYAISGVGEQLGRWWIKHPNVPRARVVADYVDFVWSGVAPFALEGRGR